MADPTQAAPVKLRQDHALATHDQVRHDVNAALSDFFISQTAKAQAIGPAYVELWQAIEQLILVGGKRFRPYLTVLAYQATGGQKYEDIIPVAASQELLHASLLMHDDIIDRDFVRYGRANISGVFRDKYHTLTDEATATHYGHAAGLLAGDLALSAAYQLLLASPFPDSQKQTAVQLLGDGIYEVAGGELLDAEAVLYGPEASDSLLIAQYKTASYSIVLPLSVGAVMAGASQDVVAGLGKFGEPVGIAYQLADDMLGLFGDEKLTGKPLLSDLQEGKPTFIVQSALRQANRQDRQTILSMLGDPTASQQQLAELQAIVKKTGAKKNTEAKISEYESVALTALESLPFKPDAVQALRHFVSRALRRDA